MRELFRFNEHATWQEPELFDVVDLPTAPRCPECGETAWCRPGCTFNVREQESTWPDDYAEACEDFDRFKQEELGI